MKVFQAREGEQILLFLILWNFKIPNLRDYYNGTKERKEELENTVIQGPYICSKII
jgi:hypothetical protein